VMPPRVLNAGGGATEGDRVIAEDQQV
jgi:hypothetical protein